MKVVNSRRAQQKKIIVLEKKLERQQKKIDEVYESCMEQFGKLYDRHRMAVNIIDHRLSELKSTTDTISILMVTLLSLKLIIDAMDERILALEIKKENT